MFNPFIFNVIAGKAEFTFAVLAFPVSSVVKNQPAMQEMWVLSLDLEEPTTVFLLGKCQVQRGLVGYSPCRCKESDTA